jgi:hypothetical protein
MELEELNPTTRTMIAVTSYEKAYVTVRKPSQFSQHVRQSWNLKNSIPRPAP